MKKIFSVLLFSLIVYTAAAQRVYFVYLQTENNQPFFVKLNEKLHSSTASGYLILSRLRDSSYSFTIGFPGNNIKEQSFSVIIGQRDHGYLIKNFGEKGWGLFNLQTLAVQMAASTAKTNTPEKPVTGSKDVSEFTDILSKASDDPSLKEKPVVPKPPVEEKKEPVVTAVKEEVKPPKKDTAVVPAVVAPIEPVVKTENKPVEVKEPPVIAKTDTTAVVKKEEPPVQKDPPDTTKPDSAVITAVKKEEPPAEPVQKPAPVTVKTDSTVTPVVIKKEDLPAEEKKEPVNTDTVALTKPAPVQEEPAKEPTESPASEETYKKSIVVKRSESSTTEGFGLVFLDQYGNGVTDTIRLLIPNPKTTIVPLKEEVKEEKKFLDISSDSTKKTTESDPVPVTGVTEQPVVKTAPKNNCPGVAGESDFLKLRKKMAAADNDDDMLNEARKYFRQKCFTVEQLKNLSTLFLKDAGKYNFFDAGYLYAADTANYVTLQSELKEEYYINRFKAMLRN